ncbi:NAD-dependent epimerase/dehydratase family protein [Actinospongicola halichondriae]|uniref:NAD-dependent epimerase/dehydratase family protein n=1 Tax=Actinospongicola halichondriae TaxID=3236844 RepID=UPI003D3E15C0
MKVVVTGGAGFIGANLCAHLAGCDWVDSVVALDNLATGFESNLAGVDAELIVGSILDDDDLDAALAGADAVVHLSARPSVPRSIEDPMASHEANATGTLMVLEAMRRHDVGFVAVASSSSVYGANPQLPKVETMVAQPMSPYAVSKLATEQYTLAHARVFGFNAVPFRFFNVFGPLQAAGHAYAAVIPAFVDAALNGDPLPIHGDGSQSRDFTYVGDVCHVISEAVRLGLDSDMPVNLAFGGRYTLLDVVERLESILGHPLEREHQPSRPGDVPHSQADQQRLRSLFPALEPTSVDDGLRATVDWHRSLR